MSIYRIISGTVYHVQADSMEHVQEIWEGYCENGYYSDHVQEIEYATDITRLHTTDSQLEKAMADFDRSLGNV